MEILRDDPTYRNGYIKCDNVNCIKPADRSCVINYSSGRKEKRYMCGVHLGPYITSGVTNGIMVTDIKPLQENGVSNGI